MAQDSTPTWQDLLDLVTQLTESDLESASVSFGDISVSISRTGELPSLAAASAAPGASAATAPSTPAATVAAAPAATTSGPAITAPMLGVFYRRPPRVPTPSSPPVTRSSPTRPSASSRS